MKFLQREERAREEFENEEGLNCEIKMQRALETIAEVVLEFLKQSSGTKHPAMWIGRRSYARLLRKLGREEEAAALEAEGK